MTVCIAAMADNGKQIVSVSDHKISLESYSADNVACKDDPIHANWYAMWADDVSYTPFLIGNVSAELIKREEWCVDDVAQVFREHRAALEEKEIDSSILGKHGYTRETFNARGRDELRPAIYNSLRRRISDFSLKNDFLVYGFGPGVVQRVGGHIFTAEQTGEIRSADALGFWAIGCGAPMALSTFFFHAKRLGFNKNASLGPVLYVALSAKFMAESADGVGEKTFVSIAEHNCRPRYLGERFLDDYRQKWFRDLAPKLPNPECVMLEQALSPRTELSRKSDSGTSTGQP